MSTISGNKTVLFGTTPLASLAAFHLRNDGGREVVAWTVDREFKGSDEYEQRPVVPFDALSQTFPPDRNELMLPLGYTGMNSFRADRLLRAKRMGYRIGHYVSPQARVWPGLELRENLFIFENAILQAYTQVGENVLLRAGVNLGHHSLVGSHTFIASGAVTGGNVIIGQYCFIGLGAVLRDGVRIGDRCFIGAGAVVIADTEPDGVYVGNPARRLAKRSHEVSGG